jgi:hypothetical protein
VAHYSITVDEMPRWMAEASEEQLWGVRLRLWRDGEPVRVFLVTASWLSMVSGDAWRRVGDEKAWRAVADLAADRMQHVVRGHGLSGHQEQVETISFSEHDAGEHAEATNRLPVIATGRSFASSTLERRPVGGPSRSIHDADRVRHVARGHRMSAPLHGLRR